MKHNSTSSRNGDSLELAKFKRAAKLLAKSLNLKHADALEAQADKEGFIDYAEAVRVLQNQVKPDSD